MRSTIKRVPVNILKLALLAVPVLLAAVQVPELVYDLGSGEPVTISSPDDLAAAGTSGSAYAVVEGKADFTMAFVNKTHGLTYSYFLLKGYGPGLVVRSYDRPDDESPKWQAVDRWSGRLAPIGRMPFSHTVRGIFSRSFGAEVPADGRYLATGDVPGGAGWQIAATAYSALVFAGLAWLLFFRRGRRRPAAVTPQQASRT
jgi:hypothetical protein